METLLFLCVLACVPQVSFAQIGQVNPSVCGLVNEQRIIAEVVRVERHPEGDVKNSFLNIIGEFQNDGFKENRYPKVMKVRHAHEDFELFEGEHILTIHRTHCRAEWYIEQSSHGEIVDASERKRRRDVQIRKDYLGVDSKEREFCNLKIKQARNVEVFTGKFELEDVEFCEKYLVQYKEDAPLVALQ